MAHQIVATSVPRGLDGVSGYQTVLKSQGIPPRVFERLKARSGYSHRYPHGDPRNPVVYVHRIEELAGGRWHVLGCIRDAGSDHTGRSNFLAHMLGIDDAEARGKLGGPAAAAQARGCFLEKWDAPPEPSAAAKTLIAADRQPRPGEANAWTAVGLDPGLAGDLAAAAMANKKVLLITRPGDDVLAMFADALSLVEPSKRWGVTFNTCAIEDFDGTWKAVRSDLDDAKNLRDGKAALIDLTARPRGSDDPYAQFARGEKTTLPWQKTAKLPEPTAAKKAVGSREKPLADGRATRSRLTTKKEPAATADRRNRERRRRYAEEEPSGVPWNKILPVAISLLVVGVLAAIPFRDQLLPSADPPKRQPISPDPRAGEPAVTAPSPAPRDARDTPEYRKATALKEAKDRLLAGVNGKTHQQLSDEAAGLQAKIDEYRRGTIRKTGLAVMRSGTGVNNNADPRKDIQPVIAACDQVAKILETATGLTLTDVKQAESEFQRAVDKLAKLEREVDELAAEERKRLDEEEMAQKAKDKRDRQQKAFQNLQSLPKSVSLPPPAAKTDVGIGASSAVTGDSTELDLGPFSVADLVNPQFHLAVPQDRINSRDFFKAEVAPVVGKDRVWAIRFLPQGENLDGQAQQPQELAALIERDGRLILKVPVSNELRRPPFALLRRSVILIEAKDPTNDGAPPTVQEIRLVEPTRVPPLVIDLFAEKRQELKIPMPPGIPRPVFTESGTIEQCKVPIASVRLEAAFPYDETKTVELSEDVQDGTDPGIKKWECPLEQPNPTLGIQAVVELSLPNATLAVTTEFTGPYADRVEKDDAKKYYIDEPGGTLRKRKTAFFNHVMPAKQFTLDDRDRGKIEKWFNFPVMPGHETALDSFGLFLKERYEEAKKLKPNEEPKLPEDNTTFTKRCQNVRNEKEWEQVYAKPVSDWADWFWSKFEKQWEENCKQFQGAVAVQHEIRIRAITSLAYDENDREYEVPLVFGTN